MTRPQSLTGLYWSMQSDVACLVSSDAPLTGSLVDNSVFRRQALTPARAETESS